MENTKLTPEQVAAKDAKKVAKKALKATKKTAIKGALTTVKAIADKSNDQAFIAAMKIVAPAMYGLKAERVAGSGGSASKVVLYIADKKTVSEDEIFKNFKFGRKDVAGAIRKSLKKAAPADRIWISFDANKGVYTLAGKGADAPAGWVGFIPVAEKVVVK